MATHKEVDCKVPFCGSCLARIKEIKDAADRQWTAAHSRLEVVSPEPNDLVIERIEIYETWEKRDGIVYYGWKLPSETDWNWKATGHKGTPWITRKFLTPEEFGFWKARRG